MHSYMRHPSISHDNIHSFFKDKHAWENAIAMYQGPDPLNNWYNYICWYKNHCHGDPENKFRETLERCLSIFEHNEFYKQDPRMVRLWLKYIELQPNPLHFYQVLHQRAVGKHLSLFYVSWGSYYESINSFKEAEAVYNLGFQEKAQPYSELQHAHNKLLYTEQILAAQQMRVTHSNQQHPQQPYYNINQVGGIKQTEESNVYKPVELHNPPQQEYNVYHAQNVCYEQQQHNTYNYQQRNEAPSSQNVAANYGGNVYEEGNYRQPTHHVNNHHIQHKTSYTQHPSNQAESIHYPQPPQGLQFNYNTNVVREEKNENQVSSVHLPPKFSSYCSNNLETWKPALFLEEPEDPNKVCCYLKHKVYPTGLGIEYSPEELMAQKHGYLLQNENNHLNNGNFSGSAATVLHGTFTAESQPQNIEEQFQDIHELQTYKESIQYSTSTENLDTNQLNQFNGGVSSYVDLNGSQLNESNHSFFYGQTDKEYEQIDSTQHICSSVVADDGSQNKSIKIKFKKERPHEGDRNNYTAYTIEKVYQSEIASPKASIHMTNNRKNGHNFHPYHLGHTSTPKANSTKRSKYKIKTFTHFQTDNENTSNSCSAEEVNNDTEYVQNYRNVLYNDNANNPNDNFLENSNCSISSAVERLNFRDNTNVHSNNTTIDAGEISTYQENSYFATQDDAEARKTRLRKAEDIIKRHIEKDSIDPFNSELCRAFLTKLNFPGTEDENASYKIVNSPLPKINNSKVLSLPNDINFNIDKEVGKGSYGSVFKAIDSKTGSVVALKYQKPPNTWEIYICDQVLKRIKDHTILPGFMDISTAIIAPNASLIATEFSPYGSLLDINNKIRQATTKVMHESLVMHFSGQICKIVKELHKHKIIHADIKPDNFLLMRIPNSDLPYPSLRLIDFGCAIDMSLFPDPDRTKFRKIIQTDGFTCVEMQERRTWSYETDLFCIAGTIHVMLFGEYMQLQKRGGTWDIKQKLPRYLKKHVWAGFFGEILNIKQSAELPNLTKYQLQFEEESLKMDSDLRQQIRTLSNLLHKR